MSRIRSRWIPLLAAGLLTLLLQACGQTGALYLPEAELPEPAPEENEEQ